MYGIKCRIINNTNHKNQEYQFFYDTETSDDFMLEYLTGLSCEKKFQLKCSFKSE